MEEAEINVPLVMVSIWGQWLAVKSPKGTWGASLEWVRRTPLFIYVFLGRRTFLLGQSKEVLFLLLLSFIIASTGSMPAMHEA